MTLICVVITPDTLPAPPTFPQPPQHLRLKMGGKTRIEFSGRTAPETPLSKEWAEGFLRSISPNSCQWGGHIVLDPETGNFEGSWNQTNPFLQSTTEGGSQPPTQQS